MALAKTYLTVNGKIRSEQRSGEAHSRDYVLDRLGSVIQIYQNGWPIADACYEPYGGTYTQWNMEGKTFTWLGGWGYRQTGVEWSSVYVRARHYSRGMSNWTSIDPLWPSELAYGYVEGQVMTSSDPSGMISFGKGCDERFVRLIRKLCARINEITPEMQTRIQSCIARTSKASNQSCQPMSNRRTRCYKAFCNTGRVDCVPWDPIENKFAGSCPDFLDRNTGQLKIGGHDEPVSDIIITLPMTSGTNFSAVAGEPNDGRGGRMTFLHEVAHACGVEHGKYGDSAYCQCNDIYACCIFDVLMGRSGEDCVRSMKRWVGKGKPCDKINANTK